MSEKIDNTPFSITSESRDDLLQQLCVKAFGATPAFVERTAPERFSLPTTVEEDDFLVFITEGILGALRESGNDLKASAFSYMAPWVRRAMKGTAATTSQITPPAERPTPNRKFTTLVKLGHGVKLTQEQGAELVEYIEDTERQLAEVREENSKLHKALSDASAIYDVASEQRDKLAEALAGLIPTHARPMNCDSPQLKAARAALAAVKGGSHE